MLFPFFGLASLLTFLVVGYEVQKPPLDTPWTYKVGKAPWPEYPRPLLQRPEWKNLNGIWKWKSVPDSRDPEPLLASESVAQDILVPSCHESALSGVQNLDSTSAWWMRKFTIPSAWSGRRLMLNFGAVDYEATVFINGKNAGFHRGGYWHFTLDVTELVDFDDTNSLEVYVWDPTDRNNEYNIPLGKQATMRDHIRYRPCSGLWQTVWLESVPESHVKRLDIAADMDGKVDMTVLSSHDGSEPLTVSIINDDGTTLASQKARSNRPFSFNVDSPELWSPSSPKLYNLTISMGDDEVTSYTGFRSISSGVVNGIKRPLLNGEFLFQFGPLDQGWWPDGLYTPPNREAMVFDLNFAKALGSNMIRKHIKVENDLFYQACDQLGLLVIQDMPSMRADQVRGMPSPDEQAEWERQMELLINQHKSFPSIVTWTIYNEGWSQLGAPEDSSRESQPEHRLTSRAKELDPSRLVNSVSGWFDHAAGDFHDHHDYEYPQCGNDFDSGPFHRPYDSKRIGLQGEFGGVGTNLSMKHLWDESWAIEHIRDTYKIYEQDKYDAESERIMEQLRVQAETCACSGAVWTQLTDVEGEVNGWLSYDRRVVRIDEEQWKRLIQAVYDAAETSA